MTSDDAGHDDGHSGAGRGRAGDGSAGLDGAGHSGADYGATGHGDAGHGDADHWAGHDGAGHSARYGGAGHDVASYEGAGLDGADYDAGRDGASLAGRGQGSRAAATAGIRLSDVPGVVRLCEAWRRQSMICGWAADDDWQVAAVDTVAIAACRQFGLTAACGALGRERARGGVGIGEAITDLAALCLVLDGADPPLDLVRPLAEGWAEAGLARMSDATCEDPLTGLATLPYLRTRLGEVYREARQAGRCAADTHRLLVVDLPDRLDPWDRLSVLILVSNDLRAAFPGGETLSLAGSGRAIAMVPALPDLPFRATGLRRGLASAHGTRLRLLRPPARLDEARRLLDELAR
jgi:hypothetical protein